MMRRINFTVVVYILFFILLNVSYTDIKADVPVNIIVIIDTSDRISKKQHPDQRERDIYILKEIVDRFSKIVKHEVRIGNINNHKLNFVVPHQDNTKNPSNDIIGKLTITAPEKRSKNPEFLKKKKELIDTIPKLYDHVQQHPQTGSDIWNWFRAKAKPSFSKEHQNLVICLSDGYLNFDVRRSEGTYMRVEVLREDPEDAINKIKNGNEGLKPIGDFNGFNIKFLMLEIRLREKNGMKYFQDFDIIQVYWETWLNAMGIKDTKFFEDLGTGALRNEIGKFIPIPSGRH